MIFAVLLLSATGYLSYLNLSSIVTSIQVEVKPDLRLLSIREISMDLEKAENSIRIYTITENTGDLQPFYTVISTIDEKVNRLRAECMNDSILLNQTDTISKLIEENIVIWNQLLYLNHNYKVVEYLNQLSDKLIEASAGDQKAERGILGRVFSRNNKSLFDEQELISDLDSISQQNEEMKEKLMIRESQLAATSREIREQFYNLIAEMENEVFGIIEAKALAAGKLAGKTYRWLAMFTITGTLLAIVVIFITVRYVRKSNAYQTALERSKDEIEKLARTKEMFMANMSHEIRTPVTSISGFTEQLLYEKLDAKTDRLLKVIKSSSDHLTKIINDILDFSKLQDGKMELERVHFSIRQISEDVCNLFEQQAQLNNTKLSYSIDQDTPEVLFGDPYRLKQIMINLVSNSVKFTKDGSVSFTVGSIKKSSSDIELILEVTDTGIGIDETKLTSIFEDFTQAEMGTARKYGGTGLGLSIVKKLVELHNGSIDCKSTINKGTIITCRIPSSTGDEKQLKKDDGQVLTIPAGIKRLKILIVDDEEYNRMLFKIILERWGIEFHEAPGGAEALEILKKYVYDIVFMDISMPGIDGIEATQYIRNELNIKESSMPVVCITATPLNEERDNYKKAGMSAFLPKPFTEKQLLSTILTVARPHSLITDEDPATGEETRSGQAGKVDLQNLYHICGGDDQFVKQMLITFLETTSKGLEDMREACLSGQLESVANLAHKLLSPCRHLGAENMQKLLRNIEESRKRNPGIEEVEELIRQSAGEFEHLKVLINKHIENIG